MTAERDKSGAPRIAIICARLIERRPLSFDEATSAFDYASIVEDGPHVLLLPTGGRYATLHHLQADIQEIA